MKLWEAPIWWNVICFGTVLSWLLMLGAKAYVGKTLTMFFFGGWAIGTFAFFVTLLFFQKQEPRKGGK